MKPKPEGPRPKPYKPPQAGAKKINPVSTPQQRPAHGPAVPLPRKRIRRRIDGKLVENG